jgi:hypothetical protein
MARTKRTGKGDRPAVCMACGELIDLVALHLAMSQQKEVKHQCGRILWRANADH